MKAVVLAAGRGSRLGEATRNIPKPLLEVNGRTCLDIAITALRRVADEIVVVTGYHGDLVEAHLERCWPGAEVSFVRNPAPEAGNLGSLLCAREAVGPDAFIITNADHLFPADMYLRFFPPGPGVRIAAERNRPVLDDEMKVRAAADRLTAISKQLESYEGAYIGTTIVGTESVDTYWEAAAAVNASADPRSASVEMVLGTLAAEAVPHRPQLCWIEGLRWFEVDTEDDLAAARAAFAP